MIIKNNLSKNLHNLLVEQYTINNILVKFGITNEKWIIFTNTIRPKIEQTAKELFPTPDKSDPNYRTTKDKEDAFCHQLASAIATQMFGDKISTVIGFANELKGGLRIFLKGNSGRGIKKYSTLSSGFGEDVGNNRIGVNLGKQTGSQNLQYYSREVVKNIQNGNYYDSTGKLVGKTNTNI